jgi:hypothetical protein
MYKPKTFVNKHVAKLRIARINAALKRRFLEFEHVMMNNPGRIIEINDSSVEDIESTVSALSLALHATKGIAADIEKLIDTIAFSNRTKVYPSEQDYVDYYNSHISLHVDTQSYIQPRFTSLYSMISGEINEISLRDALWLMKLVCKYSERDFDMDVFITKPGTYSEVLLKNHKQMNYEKYIPPRLDEPDRFNKMLCIAAMIRFLVPKVGLNGQE